MHLAYLDDAGTDKYSPIAMFGAVVIPADKFGVVEVMHTNAVQQLFKPEEIEDKFKEFHAAELFEGSGPFEGIPENKRSNAMSTLLHAFFTEKLSYIYAAIDRKKLAKSSLGSANPIDVAFRMCLLGTEDWAQAQHSHMPGGMRIDFRDMCLFIVDDTEDKALKNQLRRSYRDMRKSRPYLPPHGENRLWHSHDDLYFGDSRDSVGIQMADLCNYFMWRHLLKKEGGEEFYNFFCERAQYARPKPEWEKYRDLFWIHEKAKVASVPPRTIPPPSQNTKVNG